MADAHVFDKAGVERVIATVRKVESEGVVLGAPGGNTRLAARAYRKSWWRIVTNAGSGEYTLRKQEWDSTGESLVDVTDTEDPDYGENVTGHDHLESAAGMVGEKVPGWRLYVAGDWRLVVDVGAERGAMIVVKVWQDGGTTDGDATHECNRTYKARTIDATGPTTGGTQLGTGLTPKKRRWVTDHYGAYNCPASTGSGVIGLAYYNGAGTFCLFDANETPDTSVCP